MGSLSSASLLLVWGEGGAGSGLNPIHHQDLDTAHSTLH